MNLNISEVFDTIQGEGPYAGQPATFLRMAGCNLACSWCDTPYSWDWERYDRAKEVDRRDVADVAEMLHGGFSLVVVTGGEPLLQAVGLTELFARVPSVHRWQFETNGTVEPGDKMWARSDVSFVVSPKLPNSGMLPAAAIKPDLLQRFGALSREGRAWLKVVVRDENDVTAAWGHARMAGFARGAVWCMPEGKDWMTHLARAQQLADTVRDHGMNLALRQHLLLWPNETRGR